MVHSDGHGRYPTEDYMALGAHKASALPRPREVLRIVCASVHVSVHVGSSTVTAATSQCTPARAVLPSEVRLHVAAVVAKMCDLLLRCDGECRCHVLC